MDLQNDFDRMLFFQHACMTSEAAYAVNPSDVDVRISLPFLHQKITAARFAHRLGDSLYSAFDCCDFLFTFNCRT